MCVLDTSTGTNIILHHASSLCFVTVVSLVWSSVDSLGEATESGEGSS